MKLKIPERPEPRTEQLNMRVTPKTKLALTEEARRLGTNPGCIVNLLILQYLSELTK